MTVYKIRRATMEDLPELVSMSYRAYLGSNYGKYGKYDAQYVYTQSLSLLNNKDFICFVGTNDKEIVGFISALVAPNMFSKEKMCVEYLWWVDQEHRNSSIGVRLFLALEKQAELMGCSYIASGSAEGRYNLDRMYSKLGYEKISSIHMRTI